MSDAAILSIITLLVGWFLGRLTASVEKNYERRASRNRLIFHLIEIFEDIAKRKMMDDVVLSYAGTQYKLPAIRRQSRAMLPDEADRSIDHLHTMIRDTAAYDPVFAQEVNSTLLPAKLLDQRLLNAEIEDAEFEVLLRGLTIMDSAMMKRLQFLSENLAAKNGFFYRRKIRAFFHERTTTLKDSIEKQRKMREAVNAALKSTAQVSNPVPS